MPVGTRGAVKALDSADLESLGAEVVLANTYHLMLRPGAETVAALGGLHRFTGWSGHTLTDSGGYQVHSLRPTGGRRRRHLRLGLRRRAGPAHPRIGRRGPGPASEPTSRWCSTSAPPCRPSSAASAGGRRPDGGLGRTGGGAPPPARGPTRGPGPLRDRPGRDRSGAAGRERPAHRRARVRRLRHRGPVGGRAPSGHARGPGRHRAPSAGRPAPVPDGRGGSGGHDGGRRPRGRPVRLRGPHPAGPARVDADQYRTPQPPQRRPCPRRRTPRSGLCAARPVPGGRGATCAICWWWGSPPPGGSSASTTWPSCSD